MAGRTLATQKVRAQPGEANNGADGYTPPVTVTPATGLSGPGRGRNRGRPALGKRRTGHGGDHRRADKAGLKSGNTHPKILLLILDGLSSQRRSLRLRSGRRLLRTEEA
jgi:hypothetical protein